MATKAPSTQHAALLRAVAKLIQDERQLVTQALSQFAAAAGEQVRADIETAGRAQIDMLAEVERRVAQLEGHGR